MLFYYFFLVWWIDMISSVLIIFIIVNIISLHFQLLLITRLSITSNFCSLINHHIAIVLHLHPPINTNNTKSVSNFGCMLLHLWLVLSCLCREASFRHTRLLECESLIAWHLVCLDDICLAQDHRLFLTDHGRSLRHFRDDLPASESCTNWLIFIVVFEGEVACRSLYEIWDLSLVERLHPNTFCLGIRGRLYTARFFLLNLRYSALSLLEGFIVLGLLVAHSSIIERVMMLNYVDHDIRIKMAHHQTVLWLNLMLSSIEGDPALELATGASRLLSLGV